MNEKLKEVVKKMTWTEPLYPRDGFFGGRTGLTACYYKAKEGEKIFYKDVISLYSWVNKYCPYPVGHPGILVKHINQNMDEYFGLVKVHVLAPELLFHPVLPVRVEGKLLFSLCDTTMV